MSDSSDLQSGFFLGYKVIVTLAVFTAIEFVVAVSMTGYGAFAVLLALAIVKAALIMDYFMHFKQLWVHVTEVWDAVVDAEADLD